MNTKHTPLLLPRPHSCRFSDRQYPLDANPRMIERGPEPTLAGKCLATDWQQEHHLSVTVDHHTDRDYALTIGETDAPEPADDGDEAYSLHIDENGVAIKANASKGLLWGAMTLRQLVRREKDGWILQGTTIQDRPHFAWRGFQIDAGRAPSSVGQIKRMLRICAKFKLNVLLLREGDDELNAVRYDEVPLGRENPYALGMGDIDDIAAEARHYGITLIPEIESLGHSAAKARHYPELVSGGYAHDYQGISTHLRKAHLAPGDLRTYVLLEKMYREWLQALKPPYLHLGMDEVQLPMEDQAEHLAGVLKVLRNCADDLGVDVRPMVWSDGPGTPPEFRDWVIRCPWAYANQEYPIREDNERLQKHGIRRLSRPDCPEQVIMAGGSASKHKPYTKSPDLDALGNLAGWSLWGKDKSHVLGLLAVQWSGNMLDRWLPDFVAAADCAWNPPETMPELESWLQNIRTLLAQIPDAERPNPDEVDRHAWDAIWLRDGAWEADIVPPV